MSEWKEYKFEEVAQFPPKVTLEKGKEYSFIPMEDLDGGYKYVTPSKIKTWTGSGGAKFENGDTLFARITPCLQNGKIAQAKGLKEGKGFGSTEYFIFRGKEGISDSDFIYYFSQTEEFRKYAIGSMVGASGRQRADAKFVSNYLLKIPPLPTQRRIASILSAYDDLIENNLKRIKLLEELAQRTYEEWFVHFRIPGENLKINEETGLPEGWEIGNISQIIGFQSGFAFKSSRFVAEGFPVIKIKNIGNNSVDISSSDYIDFEYSQQARKFKLNAGDILIAMTGATVGKVGLMPKSNISCYLNQRVGRFTLIKNQNNLPFIFCLFTFGNGLSQVVNLAGGAAQPNISGEQILSIKTVIPNMEILKRFNDLVDDNFSEILNLQHQNRLLKESRDLLLPRLMSGAINVDAAEEELGLVAEESDVYKKSKN